jgi:hypothetical protein
MTEMEMRESDGALRCYGDQHRESLQCGAVISKDAGKRSAEVAGRAESKRLSGWMTTHVKTISRMSSVDDILPLISADVFLESSEPRRRKLMLHRALQKRSKAAA